MLPADQPVASQPPPASCLGPPTRVRYGVLAFACALSMITYLDRACMGSAKPWVAHDLVLAGPQDLGWVFFAFGLAYALFEVPSGWLGDVFGPRSVLIRIVLWWSAFTALTGLVGLSVSGVVLGGLGVLFLTRFLFGMGEAGAYPNITRALHNWFPFQQRGVTQGAVWMSGRLMGGLTPMIWVLLVPTVAEAAQVPFGPLRWRWAFWLFAAVGVAWCVLFARWFRNRPEEHPQVNAAERALILGGGAGTPAGHGRVPWRKIVASRSLWLLCVMYFCQSYSWYFYMTFLPGYLHERYGVEQGSGLAALFEGGPLWLGAVGCIVGGMLTDGFIRRTGNRRLGRKLFGIIGHTLTAVCFALCPWMPNATSFFVVIALSGFFIDITMGSSWASCQDIGGRYAAIVAGFMNMVGNLGGAIGPLVTGYVLNMSLAGYRANFYIFAILMVVGTLCWFGLDATKLVADE